MMQDMMQETVIEIVNQPKVYLWQLVLFLIVGFLVFFVGMMVGVMVKSADDDDKPRKKIRIEDIPDRELGALADIFTEEVKRRDEVRKEKPFDEYEE